MDYLVLFLSVLVFCACLVLYMSLNMNSDLGDRSEIFIFRFLCRAFMIDICMQGCWAVSSHNPALFPRWFSWLVNAGDLTMTVLIITLWFFFILLKMTPYVYRRHFTRLKIMVLCLPAVLVWIMDIASIHTHAIFFINAGNEYVRGPLYNIHAGIALLYYIMTLIVLLAHRTRRTHTKAYIRMYMIFTLFPIVGGFLQVLYPKAPYTIITVTMAVFYLYSSLQKRSINTDALTGLNNRSRMEEFITQKIEKASSEPFYFFIADIDCFKSINDTYGHVTGDEALCITADAIKAEDKQFRTFFAARYGGDEFVFTVDESQMKNVADPAERIKADINTEAQRLLTKKEAPYCIHLSIGSVHVADSRSDVNDLIYRADKGLYQQKEEIHGQNDKAIPSRSKEECAQI